MTTHAVFYHHGDRSEEYIQQIAALTAIVGSSRDAGIECRQLDAWSVKPSAIQGVDMCFCWGNSGHEKILQRLCAEKRIPLVVLELPYFRGGGRYSVSVLTMAGQRLHQDQRCLRFAGCAPDRLHAAGIEVSTRKFKGKTALLIGQVPGDAQLGGADINRVEALAADMIRANGYEVLYRPHPCVTIPAAPLLEDIARCRFAVTFNSTCCVDFIRYGMPFVCMDETSHYADMGCGYDDIAARPIIARTQFLANLIECELSTTEILAGKLFAHTRRVLDLRS